MVFRRELHQFCNLLFEAVSDNKKTTVVYVVEFMELQCDTHHKPVNICSMKLHYNCLANSEVFQERHQFWLYCLPSWEGHHKVVIWIEDVLYTIYQHSMVKMTVIHLD
jgi:hypothetical protein